MEEAPIYEKILNPSVYTEGNPWQRKVYRKMAEFLEAIPEVKKFGSSARGTQYKHLLTVEQCHLNFINDKILVATITRFADHKAGDVNRILTNTAASQPYCFNLIIYLQQHLPLADKLFSDLLNKQVKVHHLEPEFTPNLCNIPEFERHSDESIGDQNLEFGSGTDADVAVFYSFGNHKKGILLIEFKFIEAEFSVCSSFAKKKETRGQCDSERFFDLVETKNELCGYNKYSNWTLTTQSKAFDAQKIKSMSACPLRYGLNQLWRNMLLAEKVAYARQCDEFNFWVFSPDENYKFLWKDGETEAAFRNILTADGNSCFKRVALESVLDKLEYLVVSDDDKEWLIEMNEKYRI